jgi:hypothetical protein
MATKANFTPEEWGRVLASPMVTGMAVTAADPSGLWGLLKEGLSGVRSMVEARQNPNSLVKAVAEDIATAEGGSAARAAVSAIVSGEQPMQLKDAALAELRAVSNILDAKASDDAAPFKRWLQDVAQKAAEAGTEGGFLGFGGVAVSDTEKATLAEIAAVLGSKASATT